jgi:hypothetical protein
MDAMVRGSAAQRTTHIASASRDEPSRRATAAVTAAAPAAMTTAMRRHVRADSRYPGVCVRTACGTQMSKRTATHAVTVRARKYTP